MGQPICHVVLLRNIDSNLGGMDPFYFLDQDGLNALVIGDDPVKRAGILSCIHLKPANYCEVGGNPSVWKVQELTKLLLQQPKVDKIAVISNVVSNTRVDLVARGLIKGIVESGLDPAQTVVAFRMPGSWEDEGFVILRRYGVPFHTREVSIDQVVDKIIERME